MVLKSFAHDQRDNANADNGSIDSIWSYQLFLSTLAYNSFVFRLLEKTVRFVLNHDASSQITHRSPSFFSSFFTVIQPTNQPFMGIIPFSFITVDDDDDDDDTAQTYKWPF